MDESREAERHSPFFGMTPATMISLVALMISIASSFVGIGIVRGELTEAVNVNTRQDRDVQELKARVDTTTLATSTAITALVAGQTRVETKVDMLLSDRGVRIPRHDQPDGL